MLKSNMSQTCFEVSGYDKHLQTKRQMLAKNSKKEEYFLNELINTIKEINTENIQSKEVLESIIQLFTNYTNRIWYKHSKNC